MGNQAVGKASLARSSQDLKQSTIMMNHPGGFQARAKHCVCAHSSCISPVSLQNLLKKHMKEQDSHKTQRLRRQHTKQFKAHQKKTPKSRKILNSLKNSAPLQVTLWHNSKLNKTSQNAQELRFSTNTALV